MHEIATEFCGLQQQENLLHKKSFLRLAISLKITEHHENAVFKQVHLWISVYQNFLLIKYYQLRQLGMLLCK